MPTLTVSVDRHWVAGKILTDSLTALVSKPCVLTALSLCNTHSSAVTVDVADRQSTPVYLFKGLSIAAGATEVVDLPAEGQYFSQGIQALGSTTLKIHVHFTALKAPSSV